MTASSPELHDLSKKLASRGLAAYLPTTLSSDRQTLIHTVERLGEYIQRFRKDRLKGTIPLGIHLEGPFIIPKTAGAHPPGILRPASVTELENLWTASQKSLKILTLAPEIHEPKTLKAMVGWAKKNRVKLSLGHSAATRSQAVSAFDQGFTSVTHAWNAMPFHHRTPGVLGAALGRKDLFLEIIADGIHVEQNLTYQTCDLHELGGGKVCMVSDCAPAAGLPYGDRCFFGALTVESTESGCLVVDPETQKTAGLAGSGLLLPEAFSRWVSGRADPLTRPRLKKELEKVWLNPLLAIGESLQAKPLQATVQLEWAVDPHSRKVKCQIRR